MNVMVNTTGVRHSQGLAVMRVTATTVSSAQPLSASELAHACGVEVDWIGELVGLGVVGERAAGPWRELAFQSADLQCALEISRLQRDFDVGLEAAALMLDLQREVRRLKARLQALGAPAD